MDIENKMYYVKDHNHFISTSYSTWSKNVRTGEENNKTDISFYNSPDIRII
jgi:hypothetical protein